MEKDKLKIWEKLFYYMLKFSFIVAIITFALTVFTIHILDKTNIDYIRINQTITNSDIIKDLKKGEYTCLSYYVGDEFFDSQFQALKKKCDMKGYCKNIYYYWNDNFERINESKLNK